MSCVASAGSQFNCSSGTSYAVRRLLLSDHQINCGACARLMARRFAYAFRKCCRACLLVGASLGTFGHGAAAETIAHLTRTVWGCVDPNVAPSINDFSNPSHLDPQWLIRTVAKGKCVTLAPGGKWAALSHDYNGLTYVGSRGMLASPVRSGYLLQHWWSILLRHFQQHRHRRP